jgi:uncharacterized protein
MRGGSGAVSPAGWRRTAQWVKHGCGRTIVGLGVLVGLSGALAGGAAYGSQIGDVRPVRSLLEMRQDRVVVQEWDISCGAAALATLLTYQHGDPVPERDIARALMARDEYIENPALVRVRLGFSLLDLKRYADRRGYEGVALGKLTYKDLLERAPIMVPIDIHGYKHFVIFRGALGNRVLLADPAFGNRTMPIRTFEAAWIRYPELEHVGFVIKRRDGLEPPNRLAPRATDFVTLG